MTLISANTEADMRHRILVVAERLFREIGYQKTTVADIAKVLQMSPANVYRFFEFEEGDPRRRGAASDGRGRAGGAEHRRRATDLRSERLRKLLSTVHRMNCERYIGDAKLHEMVAIAMEENWDVCVAHMEHIVGHHRRGDRRTAPRSGEFDVPDVRAGGGLHLHGDDAILPSADDRAGLREGWADARPDDRFRAPRPRRRRGTSDHVIDWDNR